MNAAGTEVCVNLVSFRVLCFSGDDGSIQFLCKFIQLRKELTDDKNFIIRIFFNKFLDYLNLDRVLACYAVLFTGCGNGVFKLAVHGKSKADFNTFSSCNPFCLFKFLPRNIIAFWADKGENVSFASVFAHKGCRKTDTAHGLDFSRNTEHGSRQHVDFIINYKPPVVLAKKVKVRIWTRFFRTPCKYLVGCNRYRFYGL